MMIVLIERHNVREATRTSLDKDVSLCLKNSVERRARVRVNERKGEREGENSDLNSVK